MNSIIFLGTNKSGSSREAIKAAKKMGYETILITDKRSFVRQKWEFPDVDLMIYVSALIDKDRVREEIDYLIKEKKSIKAIISFIDPYVHMAATFSKQYCGSNLSIDAIETMEDKSLTREKLHNHAVTPYYTLLSDIKNIKAILEEVEGLFPLIVKSPLSTGSKDVSMVETKEQLRNAIVDLFSKYPSQPILIEEYLNGPQFLVEVIVQQGEIYIIGVVEQTFLEGEKFIVTGYSIRKIDEEMYESIIETVQTIVQGIDLQNGSCHIEMRNVDNQWKLIEVNPRVSGGAMNRMIEIGNGISIVEETLKVYLGETVTAKRHFEKCVYTHYITVGTEGHLLKVTGKSKAEAMPNVQEVYIKPRKGMLLKCPESMGHRYGYVIASASSVVEAKEHAINAAKEIVFYLAPN